MDFLKNLGFDPIMLGAQILNFLIIFVLLKRFLYKPVMDMIKKREDIITQGLKQAEEAKQTLDKTVLEEKKILGNAQNEAKIIIEEAKKQAVETAKEIEANNKKNADKILEEARIQIDQDSKQAEERLSGKVSQLAAEMLSKSLQGLLSEKEQKEITNKAVKAIKK